MATGSPFPAGGLAPRNSRGWLVPATGHLAGGGGSPSPAESGYLATLGQAKGDRRANFQVRRCAFLLGREKDMQGSAPILVTAAEGNTTPVGHSERSG